MDHQDVLAIVRDLAASGAFGEDIKAMTSPAPVRAEIVKVPPEFWASYYGAEVPEGADTGSYTGYYKNRHTSFDY